MSHDADYVTGAALGIDAELRQRIESKIRLTEGFPEPGVLFRDICPLIASGDGLVDLQQAMLATLRGRDVDLIAGIEARGFLVGMPVALATGSGFVPVRKAGKLPGKTVIAEYALEYGTAQIEISADVISPGQRVMVLDDVLATGGTAAATCSLVEASGGVVVGLGFLLELGELHGRDKIADYPVRSVLVV